jgi:DnaJ-class molecular chaperone
VGIEISAIEAMLGIEVIITNIDNKKVKVKIPAGIQYGKLVRVPGKGMPNPEFGHRGDLLVQVAMTIPDDLTNAERASIMNVKHRKTFDT